MRNDPSDAAGEPDGRALSLTPFALLGVLAAALGALASAGHTALAPGAVPRVAAAYLFFVGLALPVLARLSPPRPSLEKLLFFSCLLSPVLAAALWSALHALLPADRALTWTFVAALLLQPSALGRRARLAPPGGAFLAALLSAAACGLLVLAMLFQGSAPRVSYHGLLHASLVGAVDRAVPPENPWLAGTDVAYYWFWHGLGALFARAFALAPTYALALTNLWAGFTLPLGLYFLAAPLLRRGGAILLAVGLGLFGLNLIGGWAWLAHGAPWRSPSTAGELFDVLGAAVPTVTGADGLARPQWDLRLAFAFSKLGNLSSYPAALALAVGGLAAAGHALRHGARPWPVLTGALLGAALLVNPVVGGTTIGATLLAAWLFAATPSARTRTTLALLLGALPGAALVLLAGRDVEERLVVLGFEPGRIWGATGPVLLLLAGAALTWLGRAGTRGADEAGGEEPGGDEPGAPDRGGRRALWGLLGVAALLPLAAYPVLSLPEANEYKLVRVAAVPLAVLAAAGASGAWRRGGPARALAAAWGVAALPGLVALAFLGLRSYLAFAAVSLPIEEGERGLLPSAGPAAAASAADMRSTYAWLRDACAGPERAGPRRSAPGDDRAGDDGAGERAETPAPVLVLDPRQLGPVYGAPPGHAFNTDPNLQGHEAPAFTGLELWCDRRSYLVEHHPAWPGRLAGVERLFAPGPEWGAEHRAALTALGRPVVLLVTSADRVRNPEIDAKAEHLGFRPVRRFGEVAVFASPAGFATRLAAAPGGDGEAGERGR